MDREQAYEMWPDAEDLISDTFDHANQQLRRPTEDEIVWCDSKRERVRVVQCHWQERNNEWWVATLTRVGFLAQEAHQITSSSIMGGPLRHPASIMASAHTDRGEQPLRHGARPDQRAGRDQRSVAVEGILHFVVRSNRSPWRDIGAVADIDKARREVARPAIASGRRISPGR